MFINPWAWYIYNDKMPSLDFSEVKFNRREWLTLLSHLALTVLYLVGLFYLPTYMRHRYDSIDAWGITTVVLTILYAVLLLANINLSYKVGYKKHKAKS